MHVQSPRLNCRSLHHRVDQPVVRLPTVGSPDLAEALLTLDESQPSTHGCHFYLQVGVPLSKGAIVLGRNLTTDQDTASFLLRPILSITLAILFGRLGGGLLPLHICVSHLSSPGRGIDGIEPGLAPDSRLSLG